MKREINETKLTQMTELLEKNIKSDQVDFKAKNINRHKEGHFMMITDHFMNRP